MAPFPVFVSVVNTQLDPRSAEADRLLLRKNILPGPLWPWYASQEARRESFHSQNSRWPPRLVSHPLVQRLWHHGFFSFQRGAPYEPRANYAICFYCGQGHGNWGAHDQPTLCHEAVFGPFCTRLRLLRRSPTPVPQHDGDVLLRAGGEELRSFVSNISCKICLSHKVDTVLLPCAHAVSCSLCTSRLGRCPICRRVPASILLTYD